MWNYQWILDFAEQFCKVHYNGSLENLVGLFCFIESRDEQVMQGP